MKKEEILNALIDNPDIIYFILENRCDIVEEGMAEYYSAKRMATFIQSRFSKNTIDVLLEYLS